MTVCHGCIRDAIACGETGLDTPGGYQTKFSGSSVYLGLESLNICCFMCRCIREISLRKTVNCEHFNPLVQFLVCENFQVLLYIDKRALH